MKPQQYVFQGLRVGVGYKKIVAIGVLDDEGKITNNRLFAWVKDMNKAIGRIYTGASFDEKHAQGLGTAKMGERWSNQADIAEWEALDFAAKAEFAAVRMEADARKDGTIDQAMRNLRVRYSELRGRGDRYACDALERAVLSALRRNLRSDE